MLYLAVMMHFLQHVVESAMHHFVVYGIPINFESVSRSLSFTASLPPSSPSSLDGFGSLYLAAMTRLEDVLSSSDPLISLAISDTHSLGLSLHGSGNRAATVLVQAIALLVFTLHSLSDPRFSPAGDGGAANAVSSNSTAATAASTAVNGSTGAPPGSHAGFQQSSAHKVAVQSARAAAAAAAAAAASAAQPSFAQVPVKRLNRFTVKCCLRQPVCFLY